MIDLCKSRLVTIETPRNHNLSQHQIVFAIVEKYIGIVIMSQMVLLCTISNDFMAPYWGPRGAYVMSYQANAILKT